MENSASAHDRRRQKSAMEVGDPDKKVKFRSQINEDIEKLNVPQEMKMVLKSKFRDAVRQQFLTHHNTHDGKNACGQCKHLSALAHYGTTLQSASNQTKLNKSLSGIPYKVLKNTSDKVDLYQYAQADDARNWQSGKTPLLSFIGFKKSGHIFGC